MAAALAGVALACSTRERPASEPALIGDAQAAEIVAGEVVARLAAESKCNDTSGSQNLDALFLLFDRFPETGANHAIGTLLQYYVGAGGGEVLSCIVIRRGRTMLPDLDAVRAAGNTTCVESLGPESTRCLSVEDLNKRLKEYEQEIVAGRTCDLEQFAQIRSWLQEMNLAETHLDSIP